MACNHLKQLFQLCHEHDMRFSGTDLVRIVCRECGSQEVCPSSLVGEAELTEIDDEDEKPPLADASPT